MRGNVVHKPIQPSNSSEKIAARKKQQFLTRTDQKVPADKVAKAKALVGRQSKIGRFSRANKGVMTPAGLRANKVAALERSGLVRTTARKGKVIKTMQPDRSK